MFGSTEGDLKKKITDSYR